MAPPRRRADRLTPKVPPRHPADDEDEPEWFASEPPSKRNVPLSIAALALLAGGGFGGYLLFGRPAPDGTAANMADAGTTSAELDPATLEPITMHAPLPVADDIFSSRLLRFTIALDGAPRAADAGPDAGVPQSAELTQAEEALRTDDIRESLGPRGATAMQELIAAAKTAASAAPEDQPSVDAFEIATARLDNALVAAGLPYFVDASVILDPDKNKRLLLLYEFGIRATFLYASGDARVRSVRLRRLDRLNWSHTLLGFVNPHRIYAVVLLDQIEEQLVTNIVPALAPDASMPMLANEAEGDSASPVALPAPTIAIAARAGTTVRAEADAVLGSAKIGAVEVGEALQARRALFDKWNARLRGRGTLKSPPKLDVDVDALEKELGPTIPKTELEELRSIQKRLAAPVARKAYNVMQAALASSIERHEVQHRLDQITPINAPKALDALIPEGAGKGAGVMRDHVKAELSAYLAQIAREEILTRTTLTMLVRFVADPRVRGSAESYAALIALEELSTEGGIKDVSPIVHDRQLDDTRIDHAHQALTALPPEKLRELAKKVWARLYGRELAPLIALPP